MKKILLLTFLFLFYCQQSFAVQVPDLSPLATPAAADIIYCIDASDTTDRAEGTGKQCTIANTAKGMTSTNLLDTADILYEAELNTIAEFEAQLADFTTLLDGAGLAGGQTLIGGTVSGEDLLLQSTSHATKGFVTLGNASTGIIWDGENENARIGGGSSAHTINGVAEKALWEFHTDGNTNPGGTVYHRHSNTASLSEDLTFLKSAGDHATPTIIADGEQLGHIRAAGFDGTDYALAAEISMYVEGTPGNDDMGGRIVLATSSDGAQTPIEALRINNSQQIIIATSKKFLTGAIQWTSVGADTFDGAAIEDNTVDEDKIDFGLSAGQVSAEDIPIAAGGGSPTVDQIQEYFDNTGSSGFFLGGALSDGGAGTLDVAAGSGFIRTTNDDNAELQSFKWSASTGIAVTDDTTQYVYVDDSGVISLSTDEFLEAPDKILIGVVTDEGAAISHVFNLGVRLQESIAQAGRFTRRVFGISRDKRRGGLIFGQSGDANRDVTMTTGSLWWGRTEYTIGAIDTSGADTFTTYSASGQEDAVASQWPNTQYDSSGTLTTMTNNRWANLFFWIEPDGHIIMIYGRAEFVTEAQAENEDVPSSSLPSRVSETSILAGRFTFQKSANLASIISAYAALFANAGVTDHGDLAGLSDDDHAQYLLADGTRAMTGDLEVGANSIDGDSSAGLALDPDNDGANEVTIEIDGQFKFGTDSEGTAIRPNATYSVCSSTAKAKSGCDYTCDGTADDVQIQAAIDALPSDGGEVHLSEGIFYIGDQIDVRHQLTISGEGVYGTRVVMSLDSNLYGMNPTGTSPVTLNAGGTGYAIDDYVQVTGGGGTGASFRVTTITGSAIATLTMHTSGKDYAITTGAATTAISGGGSGATVNITQLINQDLFSQTYTTSGFFRIKDLFIDGTKMETNNGMIGAVDQITGIVKGTNTDANGMMYANVVDDGGSNFHINIYSDSAKTSLTAHTASVSTAVPFLGALIEDNTSGIGGNIGFLTTVSANTSLEFKGNTNGSAINVNGFDFMVDNILIFDAAGDCLITHEAWGGIISNSAFEFCWGDGINLASGTHGKISNVKSIDNNGNGINLQANASIIVNSELSSGDANDLGLNPTGTSGLKVTGDDNVMSNLVVSGIKSSNYGVYFLNGDRSVLSSSSIIGVGTSTSSVGIKNAGVTNTITGSKVYNFSGASSYGVRFESEGGTIADSFISTNVYGISTGNHNIVVSGNYIKDNSIIGILAGSLDNIIIDGNVFDDNVTGIQNASGSEELIISNNQFIDGTTGINLLSGTVSVTVSNNVFTDQSGNAVSDATGGTASFMNNRGYPGPANQTIAAGNTVAADACGGAKRITSAGAVTTDTTDTFTAPAAVNDGCFMDVINVGAQNITLDNNANFVSAGGADVVLGGGDTVRVYSTGASGKWYQIGATGNN